MLQLYNTAAVDEALSLVLYPGWPLPASLRRHEAGRAFLGDIQMLSGWDPKRLKAEPIAVRAVWELAAPRVAADAAWSAQPPTAAPSSGGTGQWSGATQS